MPTEPVRSGEEQRAQVEPLYDLAGVVGQVIESKSVSWNTRDLILYAIGVGAGKDDLALVYENDPRFVAFPTYSAVLDMKGTQNSVVPLRNPFPLVSGLPKFNPKCVLFQYSLEAGFDADALFPPLYRALIHVGHSMSFVCELPIVSGPGWTQVKKISGVHEKPGKGIFLDIEFTIKDPNGVANAVGHAQLFYKGAKANGLPFSKAVGGPIALVGKVPKDRNPDVSIECELSESQAIVYRLSGDYNPHCIDPIVAHKAGFAHPALQGLGTWGIIARLVVEAVGNRQPLSLKAFSGRFSSPVYPGDKLRASIWETGVVVDGGAKEYSFITTNTTTGKICVVGGVAHVKTS